MIKLGLLPFEKLIPLSLPLNKKANNFYPTNLTLVNKIIILLKLHFSPENE